MFEDIKKRLVVIPSDIKRQQENLFILNRKKDDLERAKKLKEVYIYKEVNSEKSADGKSIFTNEKARESEVTERLARNGEYIEILQQEQETLEKINTAAIEFEYLKREFKSIEILVNLLAVEK